VRATGREKQHILFYGLGFILYVWLAVDFSFSFMGAAIIGLMTISLLIVFLVLLVKKQIHHAIFVLMTFIVANFAAAQINEKKSEKTISKAEKITRELDAFYEKVGHYPENIERLVDLNKSDLVTHMGFTQAIRYDYQLSKTGYTLSFQQPAWLTLTYNSSSKSWQTYD